VAAARVLICDTPLVASAFGGATASNTAMYEKSGGLNINLWWGVVLLVTGAIFLLLARNGSRESSNTR
jgi:hypothetical protein